MPLFGLNPWPAPHAAQLRGTWTRRGQSASPRKSPTGPRPRPTWAEAWDRSQHRELVAPAWAWAVGKVSPQSGLWRPPLKDVRFRSTTGSCFLVEWRPHSMRPVRRWGQAWTCGPHLACSKLTSSTPGAPRLSHASLACSLNVPSSLAPQGLCTCSAD